MHPPLQKENWIQKKPSHNENKILVFPLLSSAQEKAKNLIITQICKDFDSSIDEFIQIVQVTTCAWLF